jgi:hypothetical protein
MQKKEMTIIDRILYLSKIILQLKILKLHINRGKEIANEIGINLFEMRHVSNQVNEINRRITEIGTQVKLLLRPLFQGKDFGYNGIEYWHLTIEDMQKGYIILEEIDKEGNSIGYDHRYILFLSNYSDKKFKLKQGDLLPSDKVVSILGNQKNVYGNLPKVNSYLKKLSDIDTVKKIKIN